MINLPSKPFREVELEDDDDFVREAIRPRKHFEKCWCGSGKKYKKCHAKRGSERAWSIGQVQSNQRNVFWAPRGCMHPEASDDACKGKIIDAHTIQRKGPLEKITDGTKHVQRIDFNALRGCLFAEPISWKKASVFPGYCQHHDTQLFKELETKEFIGSNEQCVLQAYRNVCSELYKKRALVDYLEFQRGVLDKGKDFREQIEIQASISRNIDGQKKSIEELECLKYRFHNSILNKEWDSFSSSVYFFEGEMSIVSASAIQVDYDFNGNQYVDLFDLAQDAETIIYSVLNTNNGGAIIFCWPEEFKVAKKFVESFDEIDDCHKGDIFAQYCFLSSEHTFFSKTWWNGLSKKQKARVFDLFKCTYYEGGEFKVSEEPLVGWEIINFQKNFT